MTFLEKLHSAQKCRDKNSRRWLFIAYDQLTAQAGPLSEENPEELAIILIENHWHLRLRPFHRQKLAFWISNLRHFALEQAARGVLVDYRFADSPYRDCIRKVIREVGTVEMMQPAEWALRQDLDNLVESDELVCLKHASWLTSSEDFSDSQKDLGPSWRMDAFYRHVRQKTGLLMEDGKPEGGKYSFDSENRENWNGEPPAPVLRSFSPDEIDEEVAQLIETEFHDHPGGCDLSLIPTSQQNAEDQWQWAKSECMENFGPFEDAMSLHSNTLFHTRISPLINISRLLPHKVIQEAVALDIPLQSKEGFIRQILGWREFMRHVHEATEGFRETPGVQTPIDEIPGDGGYARWRGKKWQTPEVPKDYDGGAAPSLLGASNPLPPGFWGKGTGLKCLDHVVETVWNDAQSHHITRLMILSNLATLLDVRPRELADWFWIAYLDSYDWVVEPNVLGMGTYALGNLFTTKPYVSGTPYIKKMSDYCSACRFDPEGDCPISSLYWAFLDRHLDDLKGNPRLRMILGILRKRSHSVREGDREVYEIVSDRLQRGEQLSPEDFEDSSE